MRTHRTPAGREDGRAAMDEMASAGRRDLGWGVAARTAFLDRLALSGDVARSAEAAGQTHASAYALRRHDPAFADGWEEALNAAYAKAIAPADIRRKLGEAGIDTVGGPPEQFTAYIQSETTKWRTVIQSRGIKAE